MPAESYTGNVHLLGAQYYERSAVLAARSDFAPKWLAQVLHYALRLRGFLFMGSSTGNHLRVLLEPHEKKIAACGPDLILSPESAHYIGLARHELATNASKYGAIQWRPMSESEEQVELSWREVGGSEVKPPKVPS